jgi:hypothetical protein
VPFAPALLLSFTLGATPPPEPPAPVQPHVGLTPVTDVPDSIAPLLGSPSYAPQPDHHRLSFLGDGAVAQRTRESWLAESLESEGDDLVSALTLRARAGYAFDTEREPLFADRADIHATTNNPGDHGEQLFTLTNLEVSRGVFLRADGASRAFSAERRYTTLSAEAYFTLGANAGMSLGFDLLRTGIPGEEAALQDGLFARFIIDF